MNPEAKLPLEGLTPGAVFFGVLAAAIFAGVLLHAILVRRFGVERIDRWTRFGEGILFSLFLAVMLALSFAQVLLRNLFHSGVLWFDPLVRTLVLWVAFLGALVATSHARHLHVDVVRRMLPEAARRRVGRFLSVVSSAVCAWMANGSYIYLREEYLYGQSPFLGIPSWATQSILLWGFGLLAYRFLIQAIWPANVKGPA